jgi:hypothetical protein
MVAESCIQSFGVSYIAFNECRFGRQGAAMTFAQVVIDHGLMAVLQEQTDRRGSDIAGSARNQDLHAVSLILTHSSDARCLAPVGGRYTPI